MYNVMSTVVRSPQTNTKYGYQNICLRLRGGMNDSEDSEVNLHEYDVLYLIFHQYLQPDPNI